MGEIALLSDYCLDTTVLSNIYIDEYMASNNEAQVKIYLFLLRYLSSGKGVSVISIADFFNYTVMDVERSLFFMQKQGLMKLEESDGRITGIRILPLKKKDINKDIILFNKKPECSEMDLKEFVNQPEIMELLFVAEQYMGKPLSNEDIKNLYYIKNDLSFSEELMDFLMEYCIDQKKKSFSYMAKVAKDWFDNEIGTVDAAKEYTTKCPKEMANVFAAFGIKGTNRKAQQKEINYLIRWLNEYSFNIAIIEKACIRTVEKTHTVSFEYADAILKDWKNNKVNTINDIEKLDEAFLNQRQASNALTSNDSVKVAKSKAKQNGNKFTDFSQRDYDLSDLEKMISEN